MLASHRRFFVLCFCTLLCHAQELKVGRPSLNELRAKYDAPFTRNLQSFDCAVDFSWKDHFKETSRVGDEGTDEELQKIFQPIKHRVAVSRDRVTVSSGMTELKIDKLPHGGMAEELLEHAIEKSLYSWLPAATNAILPDAATAAEVVQSKSGYKMSYKVQSFDVEMVLDQDMRLEGAAVKGSPADRFETSYALGKQGFLLSSMTMGEDGNTEPGHRLIFSYSYQTVNGFELPENVAIVRESHHEVWRYRLNQCSVKTTK